MKSNLSISVVIPVYNSEAFLASCIESVLRQTHRDLELILVDDGSSDGSGRICDDYGRRDSRVTVIHQPNRGRTEARRRGVEAAVGEWVAFVDSDDRLPQGALERLYRVATDDVDIVLGNGHALPYPTCPRTIEMEEFRHLAVRGEGTIGVPWGSLYRRSIIRHACPFYRDDGDRVPWVFDIPRHIVNGEDYLFWVRLVFLTCQPVNVVSESVYDKGDEHTCNSFRWTADYCYELNELRKESVPKGLHPQFLSDMVSDRLTNMFSVAVCCKRREWAHSPFYQDILSDLRLLSRRLPLKQRLFFSLPGRRLRRAYSQFGNQLKKYLMPS